MFASTFACDQQSLMEKVSSEVSFTSPAAIGSSTLCCCWLILVKKLFLNTTFTFSSLFSLSSLLSSFSLKYSRALPLSPATLSICCNFSVATGFFSSATAFCSKFLALRTTRMGASNSIPKTETPPTIRTSPNGIINPRPSIVPPATPTLVRRALRIHSWARVGEQCSCASFGFNASMLTVNSDSRIIAVASSALIFVQGFSLMANTKSPGLSAECARKPSGFTLLICNNLAAVTSCVPLGSRQNAFWVVLWSTS
mmetsp:Transcript_20564/g.44761  ORF Transcript_20564/g.44761 Transcript_20564/m.44761 type:complete len:255 (+) Transcript_20564:314-1078(+)